MSFFNPEIPLNEKVISHHPWERYIKDIYSRAYKYGHNSARNPIYPPKKEKIPYANRVKFTVIGDRVVKDFIHSVNLVKGLHKYRWKSFDSPVIRGVTSVEWPKVWNDLKIQYGGLAYCLNTPVAVLINDKFLGGFAELKELIETKYVYHLTFDYYKEAVTQFSTYIKSSARPCAYMHISINDKHIGTLIFMLYADLLPLTCENFLRLCKTKKGGYSGMPIHRIVKDCWIQCGGFGLKKTSLACENFIVPHDRRGVLCMANDGRHVDCSTQFFVLLQPAPWMAYKYVAFGQLVDGEETLKKIESVPTWYEAPTSDVIIFEAGIFNMECHGITINKDTNAYIQGHIEDLNALGALFYSALLENVYIEIEIIEVERLRAMGEEESTGEEGTKNIRATERFMRKKEDIEKQIGKSGTETRSTPSKSRTEARSTPSKSRTEAGGAGSKSGVDARGAASISSGKKSEQNNDFDVDVYNYEPEEYTYQHVTPAASASVLPPEHPYYIPLTDVPYPGEVDSTYDLKKFLRGDYCLESDLEKNAPKKAEVKEYPSSLLNLDISESEADEVSEAGSIDSDEAREIRIYLQLNLDRTSFAGGIIRNIVQNARRQNLLEGIKKFELITDEELRRYRVATTDYRERQHKKVSISVPMTDKTTPAKIKRRQTGFVRPQDLENIRLFDKSDMLEDEEDDVGARKVRIAKSAVSTTDRRPLRRPTAFVRGKSTSFDSQSQVIRPSVLTRLYDEVDNDDDQGPTLKDYKPISEIHGKNLLFLTSSPQIRIKSTENARDKYLRHSIAVEDDSMEQVLNIQHGKKVAGKISSDYVKTIDQIEHKLETSIRSVEFAKSRPTMSVSEYQQKNQKYQEQLKAACKSLVEVQVAAKPNLLYLKED